jgi:hypothetical protein
MREVAQAISRHVKGPLARLLFDPARGMEDPMGLVFAVQALRDAIDPPPGNLLPLAVVCESSFACLVCDRAIDDPTLIHGQGHEVLRWHLGRIGAPFQGEILDLDPLSYLDSLAVEMAGRTPARQAVEKAAAAYYESHVAAEARPAKDVLRPVQLACQNVIIGLATLRHDAIFDGLRVEAYVTCEVPHLATGEADRAMAGLLLCDAFQSGGTMEIRFGRQDQRGDAPLPASLRRYARARGLQIGAADQYSISPSEARALFLLVTPMSEELHFHAHSALDSGRISPERLCHAVMAGVWRDIELSYLLATTGRAASILEGGAAPLDRVARSLEAESSRAALMIGTLLARLEQDSNSAPQVIEDDRVPVAWSVEPELGAVLFVLPPGVALPWRQDVRHMRDIIVLPRPMPSPSDIEALAQTQADNPEAGVFLLVPQDAETAGLGDAAVLRCPQSLELLDQAVRGKLDTMRISRR